jgi:hypothetical protein
MFISFVRQKAWRLLAQAGCVSVKAMTAKDILARIGETLIQIQRTEMTINFCIRYVVPLKAKLAKDVFQPAGRRASLGGLIAELRRQVDVPLAFKATLQEYLEKRNTLVHGIEFIPGFTLLTDEGLVIADEFLNRLSALDGEIADAFSVLLRKSSYGRSVRHCRKLSEEAQRALAAAIFPEDHRLDCFAQDEGGGTGAP